MRRENWAFNKNRQQVNGKVVWIFLMKFGIIKITKCSFKLRGILIKHQLSYIVMIGRVEIKNALILSHVLKFKVIIKIM
jgi:hypothetical protein